MKKITLKELSSITGYSMSSISKVLSGKGEAARISKDAINLILTEAQKINYNPNIFAQGLRKSTTNSIGLIVPTLDNSYFSKIASVIIKSANSYNYRISIYDTMDDIENEQLVIKTLLNQKVDGLIIAPCGENPKFLEDVNNHNIPVLLIDRYFPKSNLKYITTDNYKGGCMAVELLIRNGHKKILCLQGISFSSPNIERTNGYMDTMKKFGLEEFIDIKGDDFSFDSGYIQTKLALNSSNPPTALFALSNTILLGAMKAIKETKLRIPHDISIISFDDEIYLDLLDPAITRISQHGKEMATLSVEMIIKILEGETTANMRLSPQLIMGESIKNLFFDSSNNISL